MGVVFTLIAISTIKYNNSRKGKRVNSCFMKDTQVFKKPSIETILSDATFRYKPNTYQVAKTFALYTYMYVCVCLSYIFHKCLFIHIREFQKPCVMYG